MIFFKFIELITEILILYFIGNKKLIKKEEWGDNYVLV